MKRINDIISRTKGCLRHRGMVMGMLLLLFPYSLAVSAAPMETGKVAETAEQAARAGDYLTASRLYEQVLRTDSEFVASGKAGKEWAAIEYNLGNCYYRLGEPAKALLHYERALLLDPSDSKTKDNIRFVSTHGLKLEETQGASFFFIRWWKSLSQAFALQEWLLVCGISFVLLLIGLLLYFFAPVLTLRKIGFSCALLMLLVGICTGQFASSQYNSIRKRGTALVMKSEGVQMYASPSNTVAPLGTLPLGQKVVILDSGLKGWLQIESPDEGTAWIQSTDAEII